MPAATVLSATVLSAPSDPIPSRFAGNPDRRNVKCRLSSGSEEAVYFDVGSNLDYLRAGDDIWLEPSRSRSGKSYYQIVLSPELSRELEDRMLAGNPAPQPVSSSTTDDPFGHQALRLDALAIAAVYRAIADQLPGVPPEVVGSLSQSVFKYWKERR